MSRKIKFLALIISLSVSLCLMSNTYSRYVSETEGNVDLMFANWQILVNNEDITNGTGSNITFTPTIEENANVKDGVVAPSSSGYFDIDIDPTNVDVSFEYNIELSITNQNIPDLMITRYAILDESYVEGDNITTTDLVDNKITNSMIHDKTIENFSFKPYKVRVYFEWYEGIDEAMNDEADTAVDKSQTFELNAAINFKQKI